MRSELGLTWDNILYDISYQNLIMLSKCTPNYSFDKKDKGIQANVKGKENIPEFGAKGNAGGFQGMINYFKGLK